MSKFFVHFCTQNCIPVTPNVFPGVFTNINNIVQVDLIYFDVSKITESCEDNGKGNNECVATRAVENSEIDIGSVMFFVLQ